MKFIARVPARSSRVVTAAELFPDHSPDVGAIYAVMEPSTYLLTVLRPMQSPLVARAGDVVVWDANAPAAGVLRQVSGVWRALHGGPAPAATIGEALVGCLLDGTLSPIDRATGDRLLAVISRAGAPTEVA